MTLHWFSLNYNHIFILCRINIVLSKSISSTDVWCADDPLFFLLLLLEKQICFLSWHSCGSGLVISKHKAEVRRWRLGFRLADNQGWKNIKVWLEMTSSRLADHHGYSNKYLGRVGERLSSRLTVTKKQDTNNCLPHVHPSWSPPCTAAVSL